MKDRRLIWLPVYFMILLQVGTDLYLPSFPFIRHYFAATSGQVQLSLSVFLMGYACSQLFYGPLSDRYGRKPFMVFAMGLFFINSITCAFAGSMTQLIIFRLLQGIGAGGAGALGRAIMRDSFSGKTFMKVTTIMSFVWSTVPVLAPLLGGYIQHYLGWRYQFGVLAFFSGIAVFFAWRMLPESLNEKMPLHPMAIAKRYGQVLTNRIFISNALPVLVCVGFNQAFNVAAPFIFHQQFHLGPIAFGWSIFVIASSFILGSVTTWVMIRYVSITSLGRIGVWMLTLTMALMFVGSLFFHFSLVVLLGFMFVAAFFSCFVYSSCSTAAMQPFQKGAGVPSSVLGCLVFGGATIATALIAKLHVDTIPMLAGVLVCLVLIMFIAFQFNPAENAVSQ